MSDDVISQNLVCKAFVAAQANFKAAKKDSTNPHFRSSYADLSSVIDAISEALKSQKLAVSQPINWHDDLGGYYMISTILIHESGQSLKLGSMRVPVNQTDALNAQKAGAAITYSRRYHLASAMGLSQEDDDGNSVSLPPAQARPAQPQSRFAAAPGPAAPAAQSTVRSQGGHPTDKQLAYIKTLSSELGLPLVHPRTYQDAHAAIDMLLKKKAGKSPVQGNRNYGDDMPPPSDHYPPPQDGYAPMTVDDLPF